MFQLDTDRSSSMLFNSKSDQIWRDSHNKGRGSSLGSGLDTSSEYSSETFSPLSTDSCGSPQSSQMQSYVNPWKQFESGASGLNESKEFSSQSRGQGGFSRSSIWSQSREDEPLVSNIFLEEFMEIIVFRFGKVMFPVLRSSSWELSAEFFMIIIIIIIIIIIFFVVIL